MKKIILLLALIVPAVSVWAQTDAVAANVPVKGFRGFVDLSGEALFEKKYSNDHDIVHSVSGLNTTHGYQFNENFFVGGGLGINFMTYNFMNEGARFAIDYPLFITGRADWTIGKVPLFADLRLGTFVRSFGDYNRDKFFINPSIGYRCSWGRRVSLNFGAGLSMHWLDRYSGGEWKMMPSVKIGIEFHAGPVAKARTDAKYKVSKEIPLSYAPVKSTDACKQTPEWGKYKALRTVGWTTFGVGMATTCAGGIATAIAAFNGYNAGPALGIFIGGGALTVASVPILVSAYHYRGKAKKIGMNMGVSGITSPSFGRVFSYSPAMNMSVTF